MNGNTGSRKINFLGEIKDTDAEKEFLRHEFNKQYNNIKIIIIY